MKFYEDTSVQCPFYLHEQPTQLSCEGPTEGTGLKIVFPGAREKRIHKARLCCGHWQACRVSAMLRQKYEEE